MKSHIFSVVIKKVLCRLCFQLSKTSFADCVLELGTDSRNSFYKGKLFSKRKENPNAKKILKGGSFKGCTSHKRKPDLPNARIFLA